MIGTIDHVVLSIRDLERCLDFYTRVPDGNLIEISPITDSCG